MQNLVDLLKNAATTYKSKLFCKKRVNEFSKKYYGYTYEEFYTQALSTARFLRNFGIGAGERIAVISENRPEWGIAYFSALINECIVVPIDAQLQDYEVSHIVNDSGTSVIFSSSRQLDKIYDLLDKSTIKLIILFDEIEEPPPKIVLLKKAIEIGTGLNNIQFNSPKPDDIAALIYTSGTTGVAKGVMLTHRNLLSDVVGVLDIIQFSEKDTLISVLPLHHTYECTAGFLLPIYRGASIVYASSLRSKILLEEIIDNRVTIMLGVPLLFEKLALGILRGVKEKPLPTKLLFHTLWNISKGASKIFGRGASRFIFSSIRKKAGLGTIRLMVSGGGPLAEYISKVYDVLGFTLVQGYGLTEASPIVSVNPVEDCDNRSVGVPLPNIEVKIANPDDTGIGEIIVKGPIVMKGYYKNEKATQEVLKDGWLYTGDLGYIKNNHIYITGRAKNVIVTAGGKNVFPEEIEAKLNESPFIMESLVLGVPISPDVKAEEVVAIIVPDTEYFDQYATENNLRLTEEDVYEIIANVVKEVNSKLPPYKKIKDFKLREEEFPKTSTRKIKRYLFSGKYHEL